MFDVMLFSDVEKNFNSHIVLSDHGITYPFTLLILVHKIVLSGFFRFYHNALITALGFVYTLLFCERIFAHYFMF